MSKAPKRTAKRVAKRSTARRVKVERDGKLAKGLGTYTAVYERDEDGAWIVEIRELPQCHAYGDSLSRARSKIRAALGLWVDDAESAHIEHDVRLPAKALEAIDSYREAREAAEKAQADASDRLRAVARRLVHELGLSTRDAAEVTGLSQQRIAQIAG